MPANGCCCVNLNFCFACVPLSVPPNLWSVGGGEAGVGNQRWILGVTAVLAKGALWREVKWWRDVIHMGSRLASSSQPLSEVFRVCDSTCWPGAGSQLAAFEPSSFTPWFNFQWIQSLLEATDGHLATLSDVRSSPS